MHKWTRYCVLSAVLPLIIPTAASAQHWHGSWGASPQMTLPEIPNVAVPDFRDKTIRQVVRISAGGDRIRLRLSNELSAHEHRIGSVTIAVAEASGVIDVATLREVTFNGAAQATLGRGAPLISDPIELSVGDFAQLAVTIYFPDEASQLTVHGSAYATAWVVDGNYSQSVDLGHGQRFMQRVVLSGIEVETPERKSVIVALGDSITDGTRTTIDANRRWPDRLAERLIAINKAGYTVVNAGIGGNRVLRQSRSPSALARFDRDVLAVAGASHLLILEGVNDLGNMKREGHRVSAGDLVAGYRQLIRRAKAHDIKVYLATLIPYKGAGYWTEDGERIRKEVNAWIRTQEEADGFFDLDKAIADPKDSERMAPPFDIGDALHPNDAGMEALANAVDVSRF